MLRNKAILRGIIECRLVEGRDVFKYASKTLYNAFKRSIEAFASISWGQLAPYILVGLLASVIAYGAEVHFGDRVRVVKGFYKGCTGVATDDFYDRVFLKDVDCKGAQPATGLFIDKVNLEVLK